MATEWIDFAALKREVPIVKVLERYGYLSGLEEKKGKLVGPCPIHQGKGKSSFHVDLEKNIFNCFSSCGGGNVLDLVMKIEGCEIRPAAKKMMTWFGIEHKRGSKSKTDTQNLANVSQKTDNQSSAPATGQSENPPLKAPLKNLNQDHPYLVKPGLTVPVVQYFGLGLASRGIMQSRIAIPIHNEDGDLVAYAGRAVSDELAREKGRYKMPEGFRKSAILFNLNRAKEHAGDGLIVVEGFFGCFKIFQAGFPNVVALMGSTLSEHQEQQLLKYTDRLALMFDGDEAGYKCLREFYGRLRRRLYLKEVHLEDGEQPDELSEDRIRELLR